MPTGVGEFDAPDNRFKSSCIGDGVPPIEGDDVWIKKGSGLSPIEESVLGGDAGVGGESWLPVASGVS